MWVKKGHISGCKCNAWCRIWIGCIRLPWPITFPLQSTMAFKLFAAGLALSACTVATPGSYHLLQVPTTYSMNAATYSLRNGSGLVLSRVMLNSRCVSAWSKALWTRHTTSSCQSPTTSLQATASTWAQTRSGCGIIGFSCVPGYVTSSAGRNLSNTNRKNLRRD